MDWTELLKEIFEICIIPLLGVLVGWLIKWIKAKSDNLAAAAKNELVEKYIHLLSDTISACVLSTNQTYVDALKEEGKFDIEAQKIAFKKTFSAIMSILTEEAQVYLTAVYGDLTAYITNCIEAEVHESKK